MQSDCDKLLTEVMMDEAFGYLQGKIISDFEIDDVGRYVLKFNDGSVIDVEPTPNNENDLDLSGDWMIANNNWLLSYETDKHLDLVVDA